ncbi:Hypothetical predicted protein [Podarcis lilfordi]|uniref:Uncharacterized protein n=1 Tax=Podarcis lilfordi TaxID=74358 RepID=A0AA35LN19_9SAUR|nr:Hypothetical predicted protein [Podarcis lilfordi]
MVFTRQSYKELGIPLIKAAEPSTRGRQVKISQYIKPKTDKINNADKRHPHEWSIDRTRNGELMETDEEGVGVNLATEIKQVAIEDETSVNQPGLEQEQESQEENPVIKTDEPSQGPGRRWGFTL